jgi:DNA-binding IclR family transcriptional regulator
MSVAMRELADEYEESTFGAVRRVDDSVIVVAEHPQRSVHVRGRLGYSAPLLASSAGRALLADEGRGEFERLIEAAPLEARTPKTLTTSEELWERALSERKRGYFMSDGEYELDLVAVSVPIRSAEPDSSVLAAIALAGPRHRMTGAVEEIAERLKRHARDIAAALAEPG